MKIIKATIQELEKLKDISQRTFYETFAPDNTEENMKEYMESAFSNEKLRSELEDPNAEIYFAELDDHTAGYLKINTGPSQTELKDHNALEIERIYILSEFQGNKIGQLLFEEAIAIARNKGVDFVWLGVWEHNHHAIRFYEKNGFAAFDQHVFKLGDDEQIDIMMRLNLKFSIREATAEDISQIQRIRRAVKENVLSNPGLVTDEDCKTYLTQRGKGWVAVSNGEMLGFAIADLEDENIWALFVHPDHEKKGIGKQLHDTMLNWYFDQGKSRVWLSTDPGTRAEGFYESNTWKRSGELPNGEIRFEMTAEQWSERT